MRYTLWAAAACAWMAPFVSGAQPQEQAEPTGVAALQVEARNLAPLVSTDLGRDFLAGVDFLPTIEPRTRLYNRQTRRLYNDSMAKALFEDARAALEEVEIGESTYYNTKYGSPLAYVRAIDLLGNHLTTLQGSRILDYGYGTVGHLRLLALQGAHAAGVDIDPFLTALYDEPSDQGDIERLGGPTGHIALLNGRWPAESDIMKSVAQHGPYDVFISKNTLKKGYVNPDVEVDDRIRRMMIDLGVDQAAFRKATFDALKPGGIVMIYNICGAPPKPGEPYMPMTDGRSPWSQEEWEASGFEVIALSVEDHDAVRDMASALGWTKGQTQEVIDANWFAWYTIVRRPGPSDTPGRSTAAQ